MVRSHEIEDIPSALQAVDAVLNPLRNNEELIKFMKEAETHGFSAEDVEVAINFSSLNPIGKFHRFVVLTRNKLFSSTIYRR